MAIRIVQLGSDRLPDEGLRVGTARLLPRGVRKQDYAKKNYFDVWLPELAPSRGLISFARAQPWTDKRWASFSRRYLAEMRRPEAQHLITLLAALANSNNFSIGCYCPDASRCHRSLLGNLLQDEGARVVGGSKHSKRS
jgi:uncharacterized protein YeaO (DUF488 family)